MSGDNTNTPSGESSNRGFKRGHDEMQRLPDDWVAASKTRNSALDDKCLDYYEMNQINDIASQPKKRQRVGSHESHRDVDPESADNFLDYILRSGVQFENEIVHKMQTTYGTDFVKICEPYESVYLEKCVKTLDEMKKGTPIIYQGVLHNPKQFFTNGDEKTFGAVDLLIRSDMINHIVKKSSMSENEIKIAAPKLKNGYHYRIVDIKNTKLHFNVNGTTLRNHPNVKPFKTQVLVYNEALGYMQGYKPPVAYLMGNGWIRERYNKGNKITDKSNDPFDKFGEVHFADFDQPYIEKASEGIIWYRKLLTDGTITHNPPNCEELYPNMCNTMDGKYHHVKEQIAQKYYEITQIWNCGPKERECAFAQGVTNWMDKRFSAHLVGIRDGKNQRVIDAIIHLNRDTNKLIMPDIITDNTKRWQDFNINPFYVDFETIQEGYCKTIDNFTGDFIFMIGIGRYDNKGNWIYKNMTARQLTLFEERRIINEFISFIKENTNTKETILFHWGFHEQGIFRGAIKRHSNIWEMPNFVNFCQIMTDIPIVIRGSLDFGLKSVAKAMYKLSLINTTWNSDVCDGINAMFLSWKIYMRHENIETSQTMKDVIYYNSVDCKAMAEVINFLKIGYKNKRFQNSITNINMVKDDTDVETKNNGKNKRSPIELSSDSDEDYVPKPPKRPRKGICETKETDDSDAEIESLSDASMDTVSSDDELDGENLPPDVLTPEQKKIIHELVKRKILVEDDGECSSDENGKQPDFDTTPLESVINKLFEEKLKKMPNNDKVAILKDKLMERMVKFDNICALPISDEDKTNLMEKYILCITESDLASFIRERNELRRVIENYKKIDVVEKARMDSIKKRLEECVENNTTLEKKILTLDLTDKYKKIIYNRYKQLTGMTYETESRAKLKEWVEHALKIPYNIIRPTVIANKSVAEQLAHVKQVLDESLYGMKDAKESLFMVLNNRIRNPEATKNTIAFVGPPGTGKTALILALCKALGMPYHQISLGGKHDAHFFIGHGYTYEGSTPGQIVTALQQMQCKNGILFFDEFDKMDESGGRNGGVSNLLLHITDFTQNNIFYDEYISEIPIDLSKLWFIFSLNDIQKVNPILRNRMTFINVPGYTDKEKEQIVKDYIIPKLDKQFTFNKGDIIVDISVIQHVIKKTEKEDGVREVERSMGYIYHKLNLVRTLHEGENKQNLGIEFDIPEFKLPFTLTEKHVDLLLDKAKEKGESFNMLYL